MLELLTNRCDPSRDPFSNPKTSAQPYAGSDRTGGVSQRLTSNSSPLQILRRPAPQEDSATYSNSKIA